MTYLVQLVICVWVLPLSRAAQAEEMPARLKEPAGRDWRNELVHWDVPEEGEWHLVDAERKPVPCQRHKPKAGPAAPLDGPGLYALVDLPAGAALDWRIVPGPGPDSPSRIRVVEQAEGVILASDTIEVALAPDAAKPGPEGIPPPIRSVRVPNGEWLASGKLVAGGTLEGCQTRILARGPLFAEAELTYRFSENRVFTSRVRVVAGQPVILVTESFNLGADSRIEMLFRLASPPDTYCGPYQSLPGHLKAPGEKPLSEARMGLLASVLGWGGFTAPGGPWLAVYDSQGAGPVLGVFSTFPQVWTRPVDDPANSRWYQVGPPPINITLNEDRSLSCTWSLQSGTRSYGLYLASKADYLADKPNGIAQAKRRYGETPLQRVREWVLDWPERAAYPHLFFTKDDIPALRKRIELFPDLAGALARPPRTVVFLEDLTCYGLASGDETVVRRIVNSGHTIAGLAMGMQGDGLLPELRARVGVMLDGYGLWPAGINGIMWLPDHFMFRVLSADVALGSTVTTAEERAEMRRLLAVLAYQMESAEMVPPRSCGFQLGTPNMPGPFYAVLGMIGALLSDHPHAGRWMDRAVREMKENIHWISLPDGTWGESYMYQERVMRAFVPAAVALARAGKEDLFADAQVQKVLRAEISQLAPPDPRNGRRNLAAIGDATWYTPKPAVLPAARGVLPHNRRLAEELTWAWHAHGCPTQGLLDQRYPYAWILGDPSLARRSPGLRSEVFEGAGAILRSRFDTPTETYLHLRAGSFATSHFEDDQLSLCWYAKGAPLCLDWGYYYHDDTRGADMHNRTVLDGRPLYGGYITKTVFLPRADYVFLRDSRRHDGVRRLLFVRGDEADHPEYIVLRDSLSGPGRWNLWTLASGIDMKLDESRVKRPEKKETETDEPTDENEKLAADLAQKGGVGKDNLALLRGPMLPEGGRAKLVPFTVPLLEPVVRYTGTYGVDLTVRWFGDVSQVEMGAYQWGVNPRAKPGEAQRGEHQKLLCLRRNAAGDFPVVLYPRLHEKEPDANIEPWDDGGVRLSRADGFRHQAWISPVRWAGESPVSACQSFDGDGASAQAEAFLVAESPDGQLELVLFEGTSLAWKGIRLETDKAGSLWVRSGPNGMMGESVGGPRSLRVTLPRAVKDAEVQVGEKIPRGDGGDGRMQIDLPGGPCPFAVRWK